MDHHNVEHEDQTSLKEVEAAMDVDTTDKETPTPKLTSKDDTSTPTGEKPVPVKGKRGRKPGIKNSNKENTSKSGNTTKGSQKKRKQDGNTDDQGGEEQTSKTTQKQSYQQLVPTPPLTPPPPSPEELAAAKAEIARNDRLKKIPYYREEMKEIFEYLCDRNVYWRNDLPKNKKYSNRDTRLLEKEVKKKVADVLAGYPTEREVMDAFEEEEQRLKSIGDNNVATGEAEAGNLNINGNGDDALGEKVAVVTNVGGDIEAMSLDS
ncbi:hypothetical protein AA313_de0202202 [Arthrobotrys entomopaga]|nr:hypothetical protein AA313_de0202202 [Arthrobotrys entomopaga]